MLFHVRAGGHARVYFPYMKSPRFFSLIIPAHNEAKYISRTLEHIGALDYPRDRFEAIVIENGSTDATHEIAQRFASDTVTVFSHTMRGVSAARNAGLALMSARAEWVVFLDADTLLAPGFLRELDDFFSQPGAKDCTVGATSVRPDPYVRRAALFFRMYDAWRQLMKMPLALFMIRADVLGHVRFDENLQMAEDLKLVNEARTHGSFFFLRTTAVSTSTRRFDREGWPKVLFMWAVAAVAPAFLRRRMGYRVIR